MFQTDRFVDRHNGPTQAEVTQMLQCLGLSSLDELTSKAVPEGIQLGKDLDLPPARSEYEMLRELKGIASRNKVFRSYLGMGYYGTITPPVIQRNILENPGWYTQYTPYQAEISQGRLEALLNFQTLVSDLTGLPVANASLLDEGTAAAEAMALAFATKGKTGKQIFWVASDCHPQTIAVLETRAEPLGIQIEVGESQKFQMKDSYFGVLFQYPTTYGSVENYEERLQEIRNGDALSVLAADPLALVLLKSPGEMGADIAIGSTQRFGVPMGFGGPHAAFFATHDELKRRIPGRLVGMSKDANGLPAIRLALQTREQHIRRERATSNICTAQVLLAVIASMYGVYHGPTGLRRIAKNVHGMAVFLAKALQKLGLKEVHSSYFDTLLVETKGLTEEIFQYALQREINLRKVDANHLAVSVDEMTTLKDLEALIEVFGLGKKKVSLSELGDLGTPPSVLSQDQLRKTPILTHEIFNSFNSETEMLRYIKRMESRDLSLTTSMIPLGSCTMKLNATAEMYPVTWPEFGLLHPFVPEDQSLGYRELFQQLEGMLNEITGFDATSLQPNAGSQGEYAGLLVIREYHLSRGDRERNICLIPTSAHGTNPASAVMAGMKVVAVRCDSNGNIDLTDLKTKAEKHQKELAALMVTYPSTHGVFEETIREICEVIHQHGGQVYMDGANMNAQIGLCRPGEYGPDVCHLNLHKTFCIPHGGGGPGMGPICVKKHLAPFLPSHPVVQMGGEKGLKAISAAPWGSPSILPISWMYIRMMGADGLKAASQVAILNANYIAKKLDPHFPVLYRGKEGWVAHECIIDLRAIKQKTKVTVEDVAKRLMDYGYHAPTMSWPVPETFMIEPTESESMKELDQFCDALISIRKEIDEVDQGKVSAEQSVLRNAPHTAKLLTSDSWDRAYTRNQAAYPSEFTQLQKFWPPVARVDNAYGDKNLICTCPPWEEY